MLGAPLFGWRIALTQKNVWYALLIHRLMRTRRKTGTDSVPVFLLSSSVALWSRLLIDCHPKSIKRIDHLFGQKRTGLTEGSQVFLCPNSLGIWKGDPLFGLMLLAHRTVTAGTGVSRQ